MAEVIICTRGCTAKSQVVTVGCTHMQIGWGYHKLTRVATYKTVKNVG